MKLPVFTLTVCVSSILMGCVAETEVAEFKEPIPDVVDFNYDVKPILSDTCYLCHGPDLPNAKAGFSLSSYDSATTHQTDNGMAALLPGSSDDSEAYLRITSQNENYMMPPPASNLTLSARDKAVIKKWIDQGAEYKKHWALITPEKSTVPESENAIWAKGDIDRFILRKIQHNRLSPSELADKESLIRRVTFDLTGLPPSIAELDSFLADESPDAFAKLAARLMTTPAYGERMATEWLDVARFADTHGYSTDFYRDMSPYRDWVIKAFNQNQPFDQFVTWQIAGDLLPNPSKEQILATAFNRVHAQNGEGGIVNEEFRVEYVKDRVQTIGTGLLGLTMHCAQCHDHKYDPISAKDYYSTFAFFNNIDESGQISYDPNDMPVPTMLLPDEQQQSQISEVAGKVSALSSKMAQLYTTEKSEFIDWLNGIKVDKLNEDKKALIAHFPLTSKDKNEHITNLADQKSPGKVLFGADLKKKEGSKMVHVSEGSRHAIKINGDDPLYFPSINFLERASQFTVSIDTKIPDTIDEGVLLHYNKAGILYNFKGFDIGIEDGYWMVRLAHSYPYNAIAMTSKQPVNRNTWLNIAMTYDGSSKADGVKFYIDGAPVEMNIEHDNLYKEIKHNNEGVLKEIGLKVGARWRSRGLPDTLVDNIKVYKRDLTAVEVAKQFGDAVGTFDKPKMLALYNARFNKAFNADRQVLSSLRREHNSLAEQIREISIMKESDEPKQAYLLVRGSYASHGEPVKPGVPEAILPFDDSWPRDRRGLSMWLTAKNNPLVPRVVVNRYWQMLFGRGLVSTPEDFGNQGSLPSHPQLLDWLARDFVDNGWNVKRLIAQMVNSATYQQSSLVDKNLLETDPENVLLARGPKSRLSAEMIRDNALASSGLLVTKIGGESVKPYQPEGIWRMNNMDYERGDGEQLYRRSMYTIYKRSAPPPNMMAFDAPSRSHSVGVRQETSTPLQALALLNDPQIIEASRVLAEKVAMQTQDTKAQVTSIYRQLTSRYPNEQELELVSAMYSEIEDSFTANPAKAKDFLSVGEAPIAGIHNPIQIAALGTVANMLMNHDASVIKR